VPAITASPAPAKEKTIDVAPAVSSDSADGAPAALNGGEDT